MMWIVSMSQPNIGSSPTLWLQTLKCIFGCVSEYSGPIYGFWLTPLFVFYVIIVPPCSVNSQVLVTLS